MAKFKVNPVMQKHRDSEKEENIKAVKDSEIFFIFGDASYVRGYNKSDSDTPELVELAKKLGKPFILCIDNSLPMPAQIFLRKLCPKDAQVFSFNPEKYNGQQLHAKMMTILNQAINKEIIVDPF